MVTTYSSQLNIKKIRGIIFLGFLFCLVASPSSAFFHDKDKNETEYNEYFFENDANNLNTEDNDTLTEIKRPCI